MATEKGRSEMGDEKTLDLADSAEKIRGKAVAWVKAHRGGIIAAVVAGTVVWALSYIYSERQVIDRKEVSLQAKEEALNNRKLIQELKDGLSDTLDERIQGKLDDITQIKDSMFDALSDALAKAVEAKSESIEAKDEARDAATLIEQAKTTSQQALDDVRRLRAQADELLKRINTAGDAASLIRSIDDLKKQLKTDQELQKEIAKFVDPVPAGTVAAFDLPGDCPDGWSLFNDGAGRFIVGVSPNRKYRESAGSDAYALTIDNLPALTLTLSTDDSARLVNANEFDRGGRNAPLVDKNGKRHPYAKNVRVTVENTGKREPYNVMPPYIALHFCRKI